MVNRFRIPRSAVGALLSAIAAAVLISLAPSSGARAHAELVSTVPEAFTQVASPTQITVTMSDAIVIDYSRLILTTYPEGAEVPLGPLTLDPLGRSMVARVPEELAPRMYQVTWYALAIDGHETDGDFRFEVTDNLADDEAGSQGIPSAPSAEPVPSQTNSPEPRLSLTSVGAAESERQTLTAIVVAWSALVAGILAVGVGIVVVFVKRRRVG